MKRGSSIGRPRRVTDDQVRLIREWKPLTQLARELGINKNTASSIRCGYQFKKICPSMAKASPK
jgi:radical SAM superfamily enzyme